MREQDVIELSHSVSVLHAGANVMLINGLPLDVATLELYPLLDRVAAEVTEQGL